MFYLYFYFTKRWHLKIICIHSFKHKNFKCVLIKQTTLGYVSNVASLFCLQLRRSRSLFNRSQSFDVRSRGFGNKRNPCSDDATPHQSKRRKSFALDEDDVKETKVCKRNEIYKRIILIMITMYVFYDTNR